MNTLKVEIKKVVAMAAALELRRRSDGAKQGSCVASVPARYETVTETQRD